MDLQSFFLNQYQGMDLLSKEKADKLNPPKKRKTETHDFSSLPFRISLHITREWFCLELDDKVLFEKKFKLLDFFGYFRLDITRKIFCFIASFGIDNDEVSPFMLSMIYRRVSSQHLITRTFTELFPVSETVFVEFGQFYRIPKGFIVKAKNLKKMIGFRINDISIYEHLRPDVETLDIETSEINDKHFQSFVKFKKLSCLFINSNNKKELSTDICGLNKLQEFETCGFYPSNVSFKGLEKLRYLSLVNRKVIGKKDIFSREQFLNLSKINTLRVVILCNQGLSDDFYLLFHMKLITNVQFIRCIFKDNVLNLVEFDPNCNMERIIIVNEEEERSLPQKFLNTVTKLKKLSLLYLFNCGSNNEMIENLYKNLKEFSPKQLEEEREFFVKDFNSQKTLEKTTETVVKTKALGKKIHIGFLNEYQVKSYLSSRHV